jgi:predicted lipoprotein with Yx(FWY)xxD motif
MTRVMLLLAAAAMVLAACSNSTTSTPPAGGGTSSSSATGGTSTVQVSNSPQYGSILVDSQGKTLYLFEQDTGKTSACTGSCIAIWPALTATGSPTAGAGLNASLLGTATQADGSSQVTYNGHLLYLFSGDANAGDVTGQGVEDFFVVSSAGDKVASAMATSSSSSAYKY